MWTPNQLLTDKVVQDLRDADFSELLIEFLGWLSGYASALNKSKNPVKAAYTILSKPSAEKMLDRFQAKKKQSIAPTDAPDCDPFFRKFADLQKWHDRTEAEGKRYQPSAQDEEDAIQDRAERRPCE